MGSNEPKNKNRNRGKFGFAFGSRLLLGGSVAIRRAALVMLLVVAGQAMSMASSVAWTTFDEPNHLASIEETERELSSAVGALVPSELGVNSVEQQAHNEVLIWDEWMMSEVRTPSPPQKFSLIPIPIFFLSIPPPSLA